MADFVQRGLLLNMRDLADGTDGYADDDFYPGPMFHLTYNPESMSNEGALWGLPRDVSAFALYLNLDLLAESGAPDPRELAANGEWDWDAFIEVATAIDALGDDIKGYGQNAWWGPYGYWINAAGGGFFNEDRTACALDTPEALAGLEFEQRIYQEFDVAVPYGEDSEPPFLAGNVGMFQNGRWATPGTRSSADFNWDVVEAAGRPGRSEQLAVLGRLCRQCQHGPSRSRLGNWSRRSRPPKCRARSPSWAPTSPAASARKPSTLS